MTTTFQVRTTALKVPLLRNRDSGHRLELVAPSNSARSIFSLAGRTLTNYLLWRFVRHRLNNLDQRFQDLKQDFYAVLYGRKQQPERWKSCVSYVNGNMGLAVGSLFVRNFFSEESKNDVR